MLAPRLNLLYGEDKRKFTVFLGSVGDWDIWARETIDQNEHRFAAVNTVAKEVEHFSLDASTYAFQAMGIFGSDFDAVVALIKMFGPYDVDA